MRIHSVLLGSVLLACGTFGPALADQACNSTSVRFAGPGPNTVVGCGAGAAEAKKAATLNWEAAAVLIIANNHALCAACAQPGQCKGTLVYDTNALTFQYTSTSGGNDCYIITSTTQIRMSCSACD